ncbi:DUF2380 domain-containing protein [Corallococcus terminator]|uniref:DUF2380 domain-containing protein n=1 Tax=Corallococcus terminator TaxID=2316733 RepID=A0A3A8IS72_9BACT|nr:DUF2380 domain-containing protein [Corallococcus terminator]RKG85366.1 DUF2380 domain-containing protein [Corallococcus terminator]
MAACASTTPLQQRWEEAEAECGEAREDACVTLLCRDALCGFYRCEDVPGEVVLARGLPPRPPPMAVAPAGGDWNQAWQFHQRKTRCHSQEIYQHAGELIYRFQLPGGPFQQYN